MKRLFFSIILIFVFVTFSQSQNLIGKWTRCQTSCEGQILDYCTCTNMIFKENNVLIIEYPGTTETLSWNLHNGFLKVSSSNLKKSLLFKFDKLYVLKVSSENEVLIFDKEKPNCYQVISKLSHN